MILPILAVGGAALGLWLLMRDDDKSESGQIAVKEPDEASLVSVSASQKVPLYNVHMMIMGYDGIEYLDVKNFESWNDAYSYYRTHESFFGENYNYWTCKGKTITLSLSKRSQKGGLGQVNLGVGGELATVLAIRYYTECQKQVMSKSASEIGDLLLELRDLSSKTPSSKWPIVSCGAVVPNEQPWFTQWFFDPSVTSACVHSPPEDRPLGNSWDDGQVCPTQQEYFWYLVNALTNKKVNDFYRPKSGLLYVHSGDVTAVWYGDEPVYLDSDLVRPKLYRSGVLVQ